jgi:hypothetical protein
VNFDAVEKIAAAILYEGYILYPYRPTAIKNRQRWNFGTLYPRVYAQAQRPEETHRLVAECLVIAEAQATLDVRLRFLQLVRQPQAPALAWDQAVERTSEHTGLLLTSLAASPFALTQQMDAGLQLTLNFSAQRLGDEALKLRLEVENTSHLPSGAEANREQALPLSFVSAHLLLGIRQGQFVSLLDPGESYREFAAACTNQGVFPVLAGDEPDRSLLLCSPIILYDYPRIAPESEGDFFDGTEMDEMLTLRVLTLTDAEKQEMLQGDPRARRILERTEALTSDDMLKAHGVIRAMRDIRGDA